MGMVVRSNIMALNAQRQLGMNNSQVSKSLEKLSSGFKINRAGDDASGLAISEKMKAQIKGLETASANSQDGISLIQTAEGALTEVHDMLNRMVELAEKSANGTMENPVDENGNPIEGAYGNAGTDRNAIQDEMDALATEIDRIAKSTNFNGIKLLDGTLGGVNIKKSGAEPMQVTGPKPVEVKDVSLGDTNKPATFTIKPAYEKDTVMSVGGVYFKLTGNAGFSTAAVVQNGEGTAENPFEVDLSKYSSQKDLAKDIAETVNNLAVTSGGKQGAKVGDTLFKATANEDGSITLSAAEVKTDQQGNASLADKVGKLENVTEEQFTEQIKNATKVEEAKPDTTPTVNKVTVTAGTATPGTSAKEASPEEQKITFGGTFKTGDKVFIGTQEYTFVAADTVDPAANQIKIGTGGSAEEDTLKNIAAKIIGDGSVWKAVAQDGSTVDAATHSITLKSKSNTNIDPLAVSYQQAGAVSVSASTTVTGAGETAAKATTSTLAFGSTAFAAGDTVTIGEHVYKFVDTGDNDSKSEGNTIIVKPATNNELVNQMKALADAVIANEKDADGKAIWEKSSTFENTDAGNGTLSLKATATGAQAKIGDVTRASTIALATGSADGTTGSKVETQIFDFSNYVSDDEAKKFKAGDTVTVSDGTKSVTFEFVASGTTTTVSGATAIALDSKKTLADQLAVIKDKLKESGGVAAWANDATTNGTKVDGNKIQLVGTEQADKANLNVSVKRAASATVSDTGLVGNAQKPAVPASATYDFAALLGEGTGFANGEKVTIGSTEFTFTTDTSKSGTGDVVIGADDTVDVALGKLAEKIKTNTNTQGVYDASVSAGKLVLTSKKTGTDGNADLAAGKVKFTAKDPINATVESKDGVPAKIEAANGKYDITLSDLDKLADGDKLTIAGKTYVVKTAGGSATAGEGEALVDLSGSANDADSLIAAINKAATAEGAQSPDFGADYTVKLEKSSDGKSVKISMESKTADDKFTAEKLQNDLGFSAKGSSQAASADYGIALADMMNVPASPLPAAGETTPTASVKETTITAGNTALAAGNKVTISFKDKDGNEKTLDLTVVGANGNPTGNTQVKEIKTAKDIATALKAIIDDAADSDFKAAFASVSETNGKLTFTAKDGTSGDLTGIAFAKGTGGEISGWSSSTPTAPGTDAPNTDNTTSNAGKADITFTSNPKAGMSLTFGEGEKSVTFEFVKNANDTPKNKDALAVLIGSNLEETLKNLGTAIDGAKDATSGDALFGKGGKLDLEIEITKNGLTATNVNATDDTTAPAVSSKGGGLTLQIGDTYEDFNLMNVAVNHMNMDSLFGDTDAYESMIKLDDGTMSLNVSTQEEAGKSLNAIKTAINTVSTQRAKLGALQNRLEHTINNLDVAAENMNAANSRIRDTDMAKQMMEYTKMNVLTQAAQAMLAQANQQPQSVLQLLQ